MRRARGLSLIELLVVILLPVLGKARDQGRTIACHSNLKQYDIGLRMYLDDNTGAVPTWCSWTATSSRLSE